MTLNGFFSYLIWWRRSPLCQPAVKSAAPPVDRKTELAISHKASLDAMTKMIKERAKQDSAAEERAAVAASHAKYGT